MTEFIAFWRFVKKNQKISHWNSCIRESFVGNYRVNYDSGLHPGQDKVDGSCLSVWLRSPQKCKLDMAQIFHRSTNFIARFSVFFGARLAALPLGGVIGLAPVPFCPPPNVTRNH